MLQASGLGCACANLTPLRKWGVVSRNDTRYDLVEKGAGIFVWKPCPPPRKGAAVLDWPFFLTTTQMIDQPLPSQSLCSLARHPTLRFSCPVASVGLEPTLRPIVRRIWRDAGRGAKRRVSCKRLLGTLAQTKPTRHYHPHRQNRQPAALSCRLARASQAIFGAPPET